MIYITVEEFKEKLSEFDKFIEDYKYSINKFGMLKQNNYHKDFSEIIDVTIEKLNILKDTGAASVINI